MSQMRHTAVFRQLLKKGTVVGPGCWDVLSARMIEEQGFDAAYMSGMAVSATLIGKPDLAYINQTEMLEVARHITDAISIPLIADIDDGFGNPLNVQRTIALCEKAGVAAVQMEDMAAPKRCANLGGASLGPAEAMINKIKAAVEMRTDPDFVIIARSDNYEGVDELIRRAKLYADAGADMILPVALPGKDDYARLAKAVSVPLMEGQVGGAAKSPRFSLEECKLFNIKLLTFPLDGYSSAYKAQQDFLKDLKNQFKNRNNVPPLGPDTYERLHAYEYILGLKLDEDVQAKYFPKR